MKKILLFILIAAYIDASGQFPGTQSMANASTKLLVNGGLEAKRGIINGVFTDTTTANADHIDFYNGAQIYTRSDRNFWLRDSVLNMWIRMAKFSEVGVAGANIYNSNGILTGDRNLSGLNNTYYLQFDSLNAFLVNRDGQQRIYMNSLVTRINSPDNTQYIGTEDDSSYVIADANNMIWKTDSTLSKKKISYYENIRSTFNQYTLVDKGYVDSVSGGGGLSGLDTLTARTNIWDVVQNSGGTTYKSTRQIVYNVKDFGATGDGVTDDQPFIQAAIDGCHAGGGGVVYFPNGIYIISGAADGNGNQLHIPLSSYSAPDTAVTIELRGETSPVPFSNPFADAGSALPPLTGAILKSTLLSNTSILGSDLESVSWGAFNFCNVVIKNLTFRVRSKTGLTHVAPQGTGINGEGMAYVQVDNVMVDTESPRDSTVSPNSTSRGIVFPTVNNFVQNNITNSIIIGLYKGFIVGEHSKANNVMIDGCYYGLATHSASDNHLIAIEQIGIYRTKYNIQINGTHYINIGNAMFEDHLSGSEWFVNTADIDEPSPGSSFGSIGYHRVISGSGANNTITRTNSSGSNISTYPAVNGPTYVSGYGRGLMENLTPAALAAYDFKAVGNAGNMLVGSASSTYAGLGAITANDAFIYTPNAGDITLMATNSTSKVKFATGGTGLTGYIDGNGYHYSSSTQAARMGSLSGYPGLWLGSGANSPNFANYAILQDGPNEQTVFNGTGSVPSINFRLNNGATNTFLYKGDRSGFGFANTGTPSALIHAAALGSTSAGTAPFKMTTSGAALLATPEAGAMEVLVDSLYWTGNSGTRYKIYPQGGSVTADEGITANTSTNVQLGSTSNSGVPFSSTRYINTGSNTLRIRGSSSSQTLQAENTSTGVAIRSEAIGSSATFVTTPASTNTGVPVINLSIASTGSAANNFGGHIAWDIENTAGTNVQAGSLGKKLYDAVNATLTTQDYNIGISKAVTDTLSTMGGYVNLTESSATKFTSTTIANSKIQGGSILVTVEANDGTDFQSRTLRFIWTAVAKAGTLTITISTPEEVAAVSSGTLTCTITAVDAGSGVLDFKANAVSSLTQTTLRATYQTFKNF